MIWFALVLLAAVVMFINALGAFYFKKASATLSHPFSLLLNLNFILGALFYVIGLVGYLFLLKQAPLSVVYPLSSLTYLWVAFLSWRFMNEKFTTTKTIGLALIMLGVIIITI